MQSTYDLLSGSSSCWGARLVARAMPTRDRTSPSANSGRIASPPSSPISWFRCRRPPRRAAFPMPRASPMPPAGTVPSSW